MTYTPETLRKWANAGDMPIDGLDCADAWEAEQTKHDLHLAACGKHIVLLRQQLKAAEMAMLDAAVKLRDYETPDADLDKVADRLAALAAGEKPATCEWRPDDEGMWKTECGEAFWVDSGSLADNKMRFCVYCGKPIAEVAARGEEAMNCVCGHGEDEHRDERRECEHEDCMCVMFEWDEDEDEDTALAAGGGT